MNQRDSSGLPLRAIIMVLLFLGVAFLLIALQTMGGGSDDGDDSSIAAVTTTTTATTTSAPAEPERPEVRVFNIGTVEGAVVEGELGPQEPGALRRPKSRLAALGQCARSAGAAEGATEGGGPGAAALRGIALDRFVIHQLRAGRVREPVSDLRAMLRAEGEWATLAALDELEVADPHALGRLLDPLASSVANQWSDIPAEWNARTQARANLHLAEGRVVCSGLADVELGGRGTALPPVVVEVKSGGPSAAHLAEVALYALLVGLRDGRAPDVVARWYPGGAPAATEVTEGLLDSAARRLADGITTWAELKVGRPPVETPGAWCAWCAAADVCHSARAPVATDDLVSSA